MSSKNYQELNTLASLYYKKTFIFKTINNKNLGVYK